MRVTNPEDVMTIIAEQFKPAGTKVIDIENAGGHCLSSAVRAREDVPGFDRSTVDGYAVNSRDTFGAGEGIPAILELAGEVLMGGTAPPITRGQCCLIHTGGMVPKGADAVVMLEDSEASGSVVQSYRQTAPGENIIRRGEDLKKGAIALREGHFIRAPEIGLLVSLGITEVDAYRRPTAGFLSSGDELVNYRNSVLLPGKIRDSNAPALVYMAGQYGADALYGGILPDSYDIFLKQSRTMLNKVDLLVYSGGSSVGSRDYTARAMKELGSPGLLVEGVAVQPGKPTLLASCDGKPVLGLPGHPVSALNIFSLFGRAIIDRLLGKRDKGYSPTVRATLARNIPSRTGRREYVRVKLENTATGLKAVPVFGRSGILRTLAEADGLLVIPPAREGLPAGEEVEITILD